MNSLRLPGRLGTPLPPLPEVAATRASPPALVSLSLSLSLSLSVDLVPRQLFVPSAAPTFP